MQAAHPRLASFHRPKKQLVGRPGLVPPAWKSSNNPTAPSKQVSITEGSKILLSNLPMDVGEAEIEDLFRKTVGPLRESFLVYNNQGRSKGMAIVTFSRASDAAVARTKYHNKVVDGRRSLQIEIISSTTPTPDTSTAPAPKSLIARIGGLATEASSTTKLRPPPQVNGNDRVPSRKLPASVLPSLLVNPRPAPKPRVKKGAKRVKKRLPVTGSLKDQLDKEMDDYQASSPPPREGS